MYRDFNVSHTAQVKVIGARITFQSMDIAKRALQAAGVPENATISLVSHAVFESQLVAEWTTSHKIDVDAS